MATSIITDTGQIFVEAPGITVYTADVLEEDAFEEVPYLRMLKLRTACAPEIDTCELTYQYGRVLREGASQISEALPLDCVGQFIKVEIDSVTDEDDPITWYGIIEAESKQAFGGNATQDRDGTNYLACGVQTIIAYGLLRLLEKTVIDKSYIDNDNNATIEIKEALPFNFDRGGAFPQSGNRSLVVRKNDPNNDNETPTYVFSKYPRSSTEWTALDAANYLLKNFQPKDSDGNVPNQWLLWGNRSISTALSWYTINVQTELHTLKEALDHLIDRRRGVGYYPVFDPDTGNIQLWVFSFISENLDLPSGLTIVANANQYALNFDQSVDIDEAVISTLATTRYHKVRAYGEYITSTFTFPLYYEGSTADLFQADWSSDELTDFLAGASNDPQYDGQDPQTQQRWNAAARAADKFRNVGSRFTVRPDWDNQTTGWHDITSNYWGAPIVPEDPTENIVAVKDGDHTSGEPLWLYGLNILRHLPLRDRYDYSEDRIEFDAFANGFTDDKQPNYLPLLAYARVADNGNSNGNGDNDEGVDQVRDAEGNVVAKPPRYEQLEKLNYSYFDSTNGIGWPCSVSIPDTCAGIDLNASPPQMLLLDEWGAAAPASTPESMDPTKANGISWKNVFVTLTIEVPKRVQYEAVIADAEAGAPEAVLAIHVPRARCDYVGPYTTVRIENCLPIVTTTGGTIQDDRKRVADIARAAANWYGADRKTLQLQYKQVRNLFKLGWLVTDIGPTYSPTAIQTPITAIEYIFPPNSDSAPYTRIETSFAEMDFR